MSPNKSSLFLLTPSLTLVVGAGTDSERISLSCSTITGACGAKKRLYLPFIENGSYQLMIVTLYALSLYSSVNNQLI